VLRSNTLLVFVLGRSRIWGGLSPRGTSFANDAFLPFLPL
jgi:hypothetical protein